jgi:UDP-glucose 4-epimerase
MTTAWVTGAGGFIGCYLIQRLAADGMRVGGIDLIGPPDFVPRKGLAGWQTGKICPAALDALATETGAPEVVWHLAGGSSVGASQAEPMADFDATVNGTAQLLDWLRQRAPEARVVLVSSAAVYGNLHSGPIGDDAATAPFSPYGAHKFAMEAMARGWATSFVMPIVIVRLFSVYGPRLRKQLLWDLCQQLAAGKHQVVLGGTGNELRDWTHINDVIRALLAAAPYASPLAPVLNAGSGVAGSVRTVASSVLEAFGRDPDILSFSGHSRPGDPFSLFAAPGRLAADGFAFATPLAEGIADYVNWFRMQM